MIKLKTLLREFTEVPFTGTNIGARNDEVYIHYNDEWEPIRAYVYKDSPLLTGNVEDWELADTSLLTTWKWKTRRSKNGMGVIITQNVPSFVWWIKQLGYVENRTDEPITENNTAESNTFKMYHGGKRWSQLPTELMPHKQGRYEAGVGIYFTNSYNTARRYAKGSRVVHLVELDKNYKELGDIQIPVTELIQFVKSVSGLKRKSNIINDIQRHAERIHSDVVRLNVLNNLIVNHEAGAGRAGVEISKYFVSKGADAHLEKQSGDEFWLVVFNPNIIKKVTVVDPKTVNSDSTYMLPNPYLNGKLEENDDEETEEIDIDRLYWNESYLDNIAEQMGYNSDFNKSFWKYPQPLYHCTTPEKYELIKSSGKLKTTNESRGINNRSVGNAIFTTQEEMEVEGLRQSYGDIVIQINTKLMRHDGFMPFVSKEPEVETAEKLAFVLNKLGEEKDISQLIDSSGGISEYTVIIYESIPVKYLSLYD